MKIKELIQVLKNVEDTEQHILIPGIGSERTSNIWYSFDDLWNIELYEIVNSS